MLDLDWFDFAMGIKIGHQAGETNGGKHYPCLWGDGRANAPVYRWRVSLTLNFSILLYCWHLT